MYICEDIVFCILVRLPATQLLQFRAVCNSWRYLIESSYFIAQHLLHHHHINQDGWDLLTLDPAKPAGDNHSDTDSEDELRFTLLPGENFQLPHTLGFRIGFELSNIVPQIITSFQGIICLDVGCIISDNLHTDDDLCYPKIALWNPATTEYRILPDPPFHSPCNDLFLTYGLGFDVKTNDYKVVQISLNDHNPKHILNRVDVYSLSADSWNAVDTILPASIITHNPNVPYQSGIYCWLGLSRCAVKGSERYCNQIFSFDFSSEEFGTIPVPDVYVQYSVAQLVLGFMKEKIACLIKPEPRAVRPTTEIWVLKEFGVADSWIKLYTIALEDSSIPFGILPNGKIFWREFMRSQATYSQAKLKLLDPVSHELTILPVEEPTRRLQVVLYKESLVSIKGAVGTSAIKTDICLDLSENVSHQLRI